MVMDYSRCSPSRSSSIEGGCGDQTSATSSTTSDMDQDMTDVLDLSLPVRTRTVSGDTFSAPQSAEDTQEEATNLSLNGAGGGPGSGSTSSTSSSDSGQLQPGEKPSYKKSLIRRYCKFFISSFLSFVYPFFHFRDKQSLSSLSPSLCN